MRTKLTLAKSLSVKKIKGGNQSNGTKNMKNVNFVLKDFQKILSSHKISKRYNEL